MVISAFIYFKNTPVKSVIWTTIAQCLRTWTHNPCEPFFPHLVTNLLCYVWCLYPVIQNLIQIVWSTEFVGHITVHNLSKNILKFSFAKIIFKIYPANVVYCLRRWTCVRHWGGMQVRVLLPIDGKFARIISILSGECRCSTYTKASVAIPSVSAYQRDVIHQKHNEIIP